MKRKKKRIEETITVIDNARVVLLFQTTLEKYLASDKRRKEK